MERERERERERFDLQISTKSELELIYLKTNSYICRSISTHASFAEIDLQLDFFSPRKNNIGEGANAGMYP